jgi:hypothetical protein
VILDSLIPLCIPSPWLAGDVLVPCHLFLFDTRRFQRQPSYARSFDLWSRSDGKSQPSTIPFRLVSRTQQSLSSDKSIRQRNVRRSEVSSWGRPQYGRVGAARRKGCFRGRLIWPVNPAMVGLWMHGHHMTDESIQSPPVRAGSMLCCCQCGHLASLGIHGSRVHEADLCWNRCRRSLQSSAFFDTVLPVSWLFPRPVRTYVDLIPREHQLQKQE